MRTMVDVTLENGGVVHSPHLSVYNPRTVGRGVKVHAFVWVGDKVDLPDGMWIQAFCFIPNGVKFGKNVFLGPRVTFTNDKYPPSYELSETVVGDNVSFGAGAVILPGVKIGNNVTIGAGAVVTDDVPDGEIMVGNPARPIINKRAHA